MLKFKKKTEEKKSKEMQELESLRDAILEEEDPVRSKELLERFSLIVKLMIANTELNLERRQKETIDKEVLIALIAAGANLAGILLILNYERLSVVTSKSLGFVAKLRL